MSTEQIDKQEAMEAINVLERFSLRRAEQEIIDKMDKMRDAIMRGAQLSDIQVTAPRCVAYYYNTAETEIVRVMMMSQ